MQTNQGKIDVLNQAFAVLKIYFRNAPKIKDVNYKTSMKMPDFLFELFLQEINKIEVQIRVDWICWKLWVKESEIKRMMKDYTLKELETAYMRNWKIVVRNSLKYVPEYED